MRTATPEDVLRFWFEETPSKNHFVSSTAFDAKVRRRFARTIEVEARAFNDTGHSWLDEASSALALIVLFDQLTRNVWRGSGKAFAFDHLARAAARSMIDNGFDEEIADDRRSFVYMPFMHSEDMADQDLCMELMTTRLPEGRNSGEHARKHRDVIARFGRFPYRNDALGRTMTHEERKYLAEGGYAPGSNNSAKSS